MFKFFKFNFKNSKFSDSNFSTQMLILKLTLVFECKCSKFSTSNLQHKLHYVFFLNVSIPNDILPTTLISQMPLSWLSPLSRTIRDTPFGIGWTCENGIWEVGRTTIRDDGIREIDRFQLKIWDEFGSGFFILAMKLIKSCPDCIEKVYIYLNIYWNWYGRYNFVVEIWIGLKSTIEFRQIEFHSGTLIA